VEEPSWEDDQTETKCGRYRGGDPPHLTLNEVSGFDPGRQWRKAKCGGERKHREAGRSPQKSATNIDDIPAQARERDRPSQQKRKADTGQDVRQYRIRGSFEAGLGLPCFCHTWPRMSAMGFGRLVDLGLLNQWDDLDPLDASGDQSGDRSSN